MALVKIKLCLLQQVIDTENMILCDYLVGLLDIHSLCLRSQPFSPAILASWH